MDWLIFCNIITIVIISKDKKEIQNKQPTTDFIIVVCLIVTGSVYQDPFHCDYSLNIFLPLYTSKWTGPQVLSILVTVLPTVIIHAVNHSYNLSFFTININVQFISIHTTLKKGGNICFHLENKF